MSARDVYPITLNKGSICLAITAGNIKYAGIDSAHNLIAIITEYRDKDNELNLKTYNINYDSSEDFEEEKKHLIEQCEANGDHYTTRIDLGTDIVPSERVDIISFMDLFSMSYDKESKRIELLYDYGFSITIDIDPQIPKMELLYPLIEENFRKYTSKLTKMF